MLSREKVPLYQEAAAARKGGLAAYTAAHLCRTYFRRGPLDAWIFCCLLILYAHTVYSLVVCTEPYRATRQCIASL
jgi:hypothetical protein